MRLKYSQKDLLFSIVTTFCLEYALLHEKQLQIVSFLGIDKSESVFRGIYVILIGATESDEQQVLVLRISSDSVVANSYSDLISRITCLISWANLAAPLKLK